MKQLQHILLLWIVGLMTSCVITGEDTDCADGVRIRFSTSTYSVGSRSIDLNQLKRIDLFAFDKEGFFVDQWSDTFEFMPANYEMEIPIASGTYTFVAWANLSDMFTTIPTSFIPKQTKLSDVRTILQQIGGVVITQPHSLVFGDLTNAKVTGFGIQYFTIPLKNDTYKINLRTEGLPLSTDQYTMTIKDHNGELNFDNSLASSPELTYTTRCLKDSNGQLSASLNTLRLYEPTALKLRPTSFLTLHDELTNKLIFPFEAETGDLVELITRLRSVGQVVDFDQINEYTITLTFDVNLKITININGWDVPIKSNNELEN